MAAIDPVQLSRWFEGHGPALVLYARTWLDSNRAEDVVQEVFLRLMAQRREPENVRAWLFRSVRNAAVSQLRSRHRRKRHERVRASREPGWFERRPNDPADAEAVQQALTKLPAEQREIIVLRIWCGMTLQEAAEITAQPVSTLFSRYRAGLTAIRERMELSCKKND